MAAKQPDDKNHPSVRARRTCLQCDPHSRPTDRATGGPTIVVEPHPGAGTAIGTELVSTATPDGNTLGIISNSFVLLPQTRKVNYDPLTDFAPICDLVDFPPLIVVNSESPYHTLGDLIAAARAQPGILTLASIGPATVSTSRSRG